MTWHTRAACANEPPELFDPLHRGGEGAADAVARIHKAQRVCGRCPVRSECLHEGLTRKESGLWGGHMLEHGTPGKHTCDRCVIHNRCEAPAVDDACSMRDETAAVYTRTVTEPHEPAHDGSRWEKARLAQAARALTRTDHAWEGIA